MKRNLLLVLGLAFQSALVMASTDPAAVTKIDSAREGDLASKVATFAEKSKELKGCDDETGLTTYTAYKVNSGSAMDDKVENSTLTYDADYLVLAICNTGSTFSGAYRSVTDAVVVSATRVGRVKNGGAPLKPTEADKFKIIKHVKTEDLSSGGQEK